jgi:hypothetical protein
MLDTGGERVLACMHVSSNVRNSVFECFDTLFICLCSDSVFLLFFDCERLDRSELIHR